MRDQQLRTNSTVNAIAVVIEAMLGEHVINGQSIRSIINVLTQSRALFLINNVWSWSTIKDIIKQRGPDMMCTALGRGESNDDDHNIQRQPRSMHRPRPVRRRLYYFIDDVPWASIIPHTDDRTDALKALLVHMLQKIGNVIDQTALIQWVQDIGSISVITCIQVLVLPAYGQQWLADWYSVREWERNLDMKQYINLQEYGAIIWYRGIPRIWQCISKANISNRIGYRLDGTVTIEYNRHTPSQQIDVSLLKTKQHNTWHLNHRHIIPVVSVESPDIQRLRTLMLCLNHYGIDYTPDVIMSHVKQYLCPPTKLHRPAQYTRMQKKAAERRQQLQENPVDNPQIIPPPLNEVRSTDDNNSNLCHVVLHNRKRQRMG